MSFTAVLFTDDTAKQQHETGQSYKDTVAFCFSLSLSLSLSLHIVTIIRDGFYDSLRPAHGF